MLKKHIIVAIIPSHQLIILFLTIFFICDFIILILLINPHL